LKEKNVIEPTQSPPLVLVVDDDEAARLMMVTTLAKAGFSVMEAEDCASARIYFNTYPLDIILLDVLLPDGDGYSLCREFRGQIKGRNLPIALVTGLDDIDSIRIGYQQGATDFITKPVNWGTLPYRIHFILRAALAIEDLSVSESKTRALLSSIPDIIMRLHRDGRLLDLQIGAYMSDVEEWLYLPEDEHCGRLPPAVSTLLMPTILTALQSNTMQLLEFQWSRQADVVRDWEARITRRDDSEVLIVMREITQRKRQEAQLRLWSRVFEGSNDAILILNPRFEIASNNRMFEHILGYSSGEVLGVNTLEVVAELHSYSFVRSLTLALKEQANWQGEMVGQRKNGEKFPCWVSIGLVTTALGEVENYIVIFNDITEHKKSRKQIDFLAHHDALTGLPNRALLSDRLVMAVTVARRQKEQLGVLFIDLDRFKNVNDSLGHTSGDSVLKEAASRLRAAVRMGDTVSRIGGDEFVVLFPNIKDASDLAELAIKLCDTLRRPYNLDNIAVHVTPSIGIAMYPNDGETGDVLVKNADAAMYLAKENGRNNYQFYTPTLNARTLDRLKLESNLRDAIEAGSFELHYQPQVIAGTQKLWGAEALVRWRDSKLGLIPPSDFIPLAEESGLIIPLGIWVMKEAARQVTHWRKNGYPELIISVNISALQFRQLDFLEQTQALFESLGAVPESIELELTESILMSDMEASIATLNRLCELGFRISIDDFGTGYSSLNYLRRLPVQILKIDQSFIREMLQESASLAIVDSIITLAHALGKDTIAEGVETAEEYKLLCDHHCRIIQGYYFSCPLSAREFEQWIAQKKNLIVEPV
jgi:diguanylate cyclase (GGDEF)-like protein/PAS domain S-box-containing protein